jgi:hypothetical protein
VSEVYVITAFRAGAGPGPGRGLHSPAGEAAVFWRSAPGAASGCPVPQTRPPAGYLLAIGLVFGAEAIGQ